MKCSVTERSLNRLFLAKRFFCFMSLVFTCILTLPGCVPMQASTTYSGRKLILVVPIVNQSDKKLFPDQYYDERQLFSINWKSFSDRGYDIVEATVTSKGLSAAISDGLCVSPQLLNSIVSGSHSGPVVPDEYSYVIVISIDSAKQKTFLVPLLKWSPESQISIVLINNRDGSLYWSNTTSIIWDVKDEPFSSDYYLYPANLTGAMSDCPLLSGN